MAVCNRTGIKPFTTEGTEDTGGKQRKVLI